MRHAGRRSLLRLRHPCRVTRAAQRGRRDCGEALVALQIGLPGSGNGLAAVQEGHRDCGEVLAALQIGVAGSRRCDHGAATSDSRFRGVCCSGAKAPPATAGPCWLRSKRVPAMRGVCCGGASASPKTSGACLLRSKRVPAMRGVCCSGASASPKTSGACLLRSKRVPRLRGVCCSGASTSPKTSGACLLRSKKVPAAGTSRLPGGCCLCGDTPRVYREPCSADARCGETAGPRRAARRRTPSAKSPGGGKRLTTRNWPWSDGMSKK
jgi:hypothetical protein